nr:acidic leucine-rich nuclear phosphoprotein 32-related protein 2-like [Ipomoea batatas]
MKVSLNNKPPDLAAVGCPDSCCSASDVESEECKLERDNNSRVRPSTRQAYQEPSLGSSFQSKQIVVVAIPIKEGCYDGVPAFCVEREVVTGERLQDEVNDGLGGESKEYENRQQNDAQNPIPYPPCNPAAIAEHHEVLEPGEENRETPEESHHEALPHLGDHRHDSPEGDLLGGVDAGDGVHDGGGGEEGEDEEEDEVGDLEEPEGGPFRGENVGDLLVRLRAPLDPVEDVLVAEDVGEEDVGDLDVRQVDEGERDDHGGCNLGEDLLPCGNQAK